MITKKEFIKSENLHKEYIEKSEDLNEKCYGSESDSLNCDVDYFIKELQEKKRKIETQKNIKDIRFKQIWTGYESCYFSICYKQLETDEEFQDRIKLKYNIYKENYEKKEKEQKMNEEKYKEELRVLKNKYNKNID